MKYIIFDKISIILLSVLLVMIFMPTEFKNLVKKGLDPVIQEYEGAVHRKARVEYAKGSTSLTKLIIKNKTLPKERILSKKKELALIVQRMSKEDVAEKKKNLIKDLKVLPAKKRRENLAKYHLLTVLEPENKIYRQKVSFYEKEKKVRQKKLSSRNVKSSVWEGSYRCAQGKTKLQLTLNVDKSGFVKAGFSFYVRSGKEFGKFTLSGKIKRAGLRLKPVAWINRPSGYGMVTLDGKFSQGGRVYSGRVLFPGCSTFSVKKVTGTVSY